MNSATVVVSCYKQEKYIAACMDSILSQETSYPFKLVVCDDKSPDGTPAILQDYKSKYPDKIELVLRSENVGAAKNYIDGHNRANGDVVFHIDGDDLMCPGKIQTQMSLFDDPTVNLSFHRAYYFTDEDDVRMPTGACPPNPPNKRVEFTAKDLALWGTIAVHSSYTYRRSSRKTRSLNREFMEWFWAMDSLREGGKGVYVNQVLGGYRFNPNGSSYLSTSKGRKKAYLLYFLDIRTYFDSLKNLRRQLYANAVVSFIAMTVKGRFFDLPTFAFILKNIAYLRPKLVVESYKVRSSVRPRLEPDSE
ncbi:MAG: glycosyltransferase [Bdellovibrio sp.]|nr:glycosyltransferase [Bdellovibrio sp.]